MQTTMPEHENMIHQVKEIYVTSDKNYVNDQLSNGWILLSASPQIEKDSEAKPTAFKWCIGRIK